MPTQQTFPVTHAVCRDLARTFEQALALEPPPEPIDVPKAHIQHKNYTSLLQEILTNVVELPADDACPDCVFIEDAALVINKSHAVITRPGAPSRQPETEPVAAALRQLGIPRIDVLKAPATLDGGDVLVLPWALLVGTSKRTNDAAVEQLRGLLAEAGGPPLFAFSVGAAVAVAGGGVNTLHFKSLLSALDPHTLLVADTPIGRALADQIRAVPELAAGLKLAFVPDPIASNVLSLGHTVVMQDGYPSSEAVVRRLCEARGLGLRTLCMSELAKADGALTCCSLLFEGPEAAGDGARAGATGAGKEEEVGN